jgi:TPR repeat protein
VAIAAILAATTMPGLAAAQAPKPGPSATEPKPAEAPDELKPAFDALRAKDYAKAERILKPLADKKDIQAQFVLGAEVYGFSGSPLHSMQKAIPLLKDAAERGLPIAMAYYGGALADGVGIPKDKVEAYKFIALASRHKVPDTELLLARLAQDMSEEEIDRAKQAANDFVPRK